MRRRPVVTILMLIIAVILTLPMWAQQKPFTQEQVSNMVRDGFGDESGAKLIEQRGVVLELRGLYTREPPKSRRV